MNELSRDNKTPAILVHGGAWATPEEEQKAHLEGVRQAAIIGFEVYKKTAHLRMLCSERWSTWKQIPRLMRVEELY